MRTHGVAKGDSAEASDKNAGYVDDIDAGFTSTGQGIDNVLD